MDQEILEDVTNLVIKTLSLNRTKNCWLSIDILNLLAFFNVKKRSDIEMILNNIFSELINYGINFENLLISAFTNNFLENRTFNTLSSKPYVNSLSKFIFDQNYRFRSMHPFYSFFNFGSQKNFKSLDQYTDSFGSKSIFDFMIKNDFYLITLGHHYVQSFPIVHHLEHLIGSPYREENIFFGILSDGFTNLEGPFNYYSRKINICERSGLTFKALEAMERKSIVKKSLIKISNKKIYSYQINIKESADYIISRHSEKNLLVDFFHTKTHPSKKIVTIPESILIYEKLLKSN